VHTSYGARSASTCVDEMAQYKTWYTLDGIFLDEMATSPGDEAYYESLASSARDLGLNFLVGNPGSEPESDTFYSVGIDVLMVFESGYLPMDLQPVSGYRALYQRGVFPYGIPAPLNTTWIAQARQSVGWVFVQNDTLPNPWDTVPAFFDDLLAILDYNSS